MEDFSRWRRRDVMAMGGATLFSALAAAKPLEPNPIAAIEKTLGGRIGVTALDTHSGARVTRRGDERFAMCSTFKWLLAATVLARSDDGRLTLKRRIAYAAADLLHHSPITQAHLHEGSMTVEALCAAAVEESDNTAANMLLRLIGGPPAVTAYLRGVGDSFTRLDRFELALNENLPGDPRDTTTPNAQIATMNRILLGHALAADSRDTLVSWMKNCRTGLDRLRAGLPKSWIVADKTGTGTGSGATSAANDVATAWPPGRAPILIASYISGSPAPLEKQSAAHAEIGRVIARVFA
jgi:beta-lactamase class A